jgi:hypothetical protein
MAAGSVCTLSGARGESARAFPRGIRNVASSSAAKHAQAAARKARWFADAWAARIKAELPPAAASAVASPL